MSFHQDLAPIECGPRTIAATYFGGKLISTVKLMHTWVIAGVEYPYETLVFDREGHEIDAAQKCFAFQGSGRGGWN